VFNTAQIKNSIHAEIMGNIEVLKHCIGGRMSGSRKPAQRKKDENK
jgi:hypothetical protein